MNCYGFLVAAAFASCLLDSSSAALTASMSFDDVMLQLYTEPKCQDFVMPQNFDQGLIAVDKKDDCGGVRCDWPNEICFTTGFSGHGKGQSRNCRRIPSSCRSALPGGSPIEPVDFGTTTAEPEPVGPKYDCSQPRDRGTKCLSSYQRLFAFDARRGRCVLLYYGGCDGNNNRFESLLLCRRTCEGSKPVTTRTRTTTTTPSPPAPSGGDVCLEKRVIGSRSCGQLSRSYYYYNSVRKSCSRTYFYKGCPSSGNLFTSLSVCRQTCEKSTADCTSPKDSGEFCEGQSRRYQRQYYFNTKTQSCGVLYYKGCGGNGNKYASSTECRTACQ